MVLTDTSVWSLALRRQTKDLSSQQQPIVTEWFRLVENADICLIGPIRQEILSGVRHKQQFVTLEERLTPFRDVPIETVDLCGSCTIL
jgi:hypothetical protein